MSLSAPRILLIAVLAGLLAPCAVAGASTVPINPFGRSGDLHVDFPTYAAADSHTQGSPPEANLQQVGDVNGDGRADLAMAVSSGDSAWTTTTWVTFTPAALAWSGGVGDPGWSGLRIVGAGSRITGIAGLGDVNGDRIGDLAVAGESATWVIFGGPATATVDVQNLGPRGFTIDITQRPCFNGGGGNSWTGVFSQDTSVVGLGDQNGDGRGDVAVCETGAVHVVFRRRALPARRSSPAAAGRTSRRSPSTAATSRAWRPQAMPTATGAATC
jgi:hypothetical protein